MLEVAFRYNQSHGVWFEASGAMGRTHCKACDYDEVAEASRQDRMGLQRHSEACYK